jgi:RND family efflux transporter MFP subunit
MSPNPSSLSSSSSSSGSAQAERSHQLEENDASNVNKSSALVLASDVKPEDDEPGSKRPGPKVWLWGALILLLLGGGGFLVFRAFSSRENPAAQAPPPVPVKVQTIEPGQVRSTAEFVGKLEAQQRVSLQPQIQGRIDRVLVSSGDYVAQGTPIVSLSLDQTQSDVSSAIAVVNSNRAAVATADAQRQSAEADRVKAASDVKLQQTEFKRTQSLVAQGAQARQELDIARNNLETAIATLNAAEKKVSASQASINQAQANVQQAQAQVASSQVNLSQKLVVAPVNGVVGDFAFKPGDYVGIGQTLTSITKNDVLDMRLSVPSNNVGQLRLGLPVELLDAGTGKRLTRGSVNFISPQVDANAQSILVKARFANADGKLRDGQYVRARIIWNQQPGILVPTQAVNRIGGQSFVFMVEEKRVKEKSQFTVHQKPVKLGEVQNDQYPVLDGIKTGDRLAVSNILKLRDGAPIQPGT